MMRPTSTLLLTLALACTPAGGDDEVAAPEDTTTSNGSTTTSASSSDSTDSTDATTSTDATSSDATSSDASDSTDATTMGSAETGTSDSTGSDASSTDGAETETGGVSCELNDGWEVNESAEQASEVAWTASDAWSSYRTLDDGYLCAGEDDWYRFETDSLGYAEHYFYIRALIKDAGLCGASCGDPVIPQGPEHAMTIDVHRADTLELIGTSSSDTGVLWFNGPGGDAFAHDVLLHVYSTTPDAEYPYRLSVSIRNYDGEDECEC